MKRCLNESCGKEFEPPPDIPDQDTCSHKCFVAYIRRHQYDRVRARGKKIGQFAQFMAK